MRSPTLGEIMNRTNIALIPKVLNPNSLKEFRLISLCCVQSGDQGDFK